MPNKMERFTQRARRVLSMAQEEAHRLQHSYIGTEHLLLGLMREEGGVAGRVLRELGLELRRVEDLVERLTRAAATTEDPTQIDLSPGVKKVLELAVDEARRMGHHYIGTEHLLLGLVRQTEGIAIEILKRLGVSPEEVRRQTRRILQEVPEAATKPDERPTIASAGRLRARAEQARLIRRQFIPASVISDLSPWLQTISDTDIDEEPLPESPAQRTGSAKMERFTQRARRVLSLAQEEAERFQHNHIGTEHLLLGLMREEGGVAGRVLRDLGLDQRRVEEMVARLTHAASRNPSSKLDLAPATQKVLELAVDEARRMGHHYIGTEHLLLGLVRQAEGVAIEVLKRQGIAPEEIRRQTRRLLQESPAAAQATSPRTKTIVLSVNELRAQLKALENGIVDRDRLRQHIASLSATYEDQLKRYHEERQQYAQNVIRDLRLQGISLPFRETLERQPVLVETIVHDPEWLRLVTALYGGYANFDSAAIVRDYNELMTFVYSAEAVQSFLIENELYSNQWGAARWGGNTTAETAANIVTYFNNGMDGRLNLALIAPHFSPAYIYRDSPLTPELLYALQNGRPAHGLIPYLWTQWRTARDDNQRVAAMTALIALGENVIADLERALAVPEQAGMANRILNHFRLTAELLSDALVRGTLQTQIVSLMYTLARATLSIPSPQRADFVARVVRALPNHQPVPIDISVFTGHPYFYAEAWAYWLSRFDADPTKYLAEILTQFGLLTLPVDAFTSYHLAHNRHWRSGVRVAHEDFPPVYRDHGTRLLDFLSMVQQTDFGNLAVQAQLKSLLENLRSQYPKEYALIFWIVVKGFTLRAEDFDELVARATAEPNPALRARALLLLVLKAQGPLQQTLVTQADQAVHAIESPFDRIRAREEVMGFLDFENRQEMVKVILQERALMQDTANEARLLMRLSRVARRSQVPELYQAALETAANIPDEREKAETLALLMPLLSSEPDLYRQARAMLFQDDYLHDYANNLTARYLVKLQPTLQREALGNSEVWSLVVLRALADDLTGYFASDPDENRLWASLFDDASRAEALAQLMMLSQRETMPITSYVAETIEQLLNGGAFDTVLQVLPMLEGVETGAQGLVQSWLASPHPLVSAHAALLLSKANPVTEHYLPGLLYLLEHGDDRSRLRARLALHGDLILINKTNRTLRASQLGLRGLQMLAASDLRLNEMMLQIGDTVSRTWNNIIHDSPEIVQTCISLLENDSENDDEDQFSGRTLAGIILQGIYDAVPAVIEVMLQTLETTVSEHVGKALLMSLRMMAHRGVPRVLSAMTRVREKIVTLSDEVHAHMRVLPERALSVAAVVEAVNLERSVYEGDALYEHANSRLWERYVSLDKRSLAELGTAALYILDKDELAAREAAKKIISTRMQFDLMLEWLAYALANNKGDFARHNSALLEVAAECASLQPAAFATKADALNLEQLLLHAAQYDQVFFGRRGAMRMVRYLRRVSSQFAETMRVVMRDLDFVQRETLITALNLRVIDDRILPALTEQLYDHSATVAYAAAHLLRALGQNEKLQSEQRLTILNAFARAIRDPRSQRGVYVFSGGRVEIPYRIEYLGRLDRIFYQTLSELAGMT